MNACDVACRPACSVLHRTRTTVQAEKRDRKIEALEQRLAVMTRQDAEHVEDKQARASVRSSLVLTQQRTLGTPWALDGYSMGTAWAVHGPHAMLHTM